MWHVDVEDGGLDDGSVDAYGRVRCGCRGWDVDNAGVDAMTAGCGRWKSWMKCGRWGGIWTMGWDVDDRMGCPQSMHGPYQDYLRAQIRLRIAATHSSVMASVLQARGAARLLELVNSRSESDAAASTAMEVAEEEFVDTPKAEIEMMDSGLVPGVVDCVSISEVAIASVTLPCWL